MTLDRKSILNYIIMFAIMIVIGTLSPIGSITQMGMKVLGVFIGVIYGWIMIDIIPVSMIGFVCLGLTGYKPLLQIVASGFSNTIIITILLSVIFTGAVAKTRCMDIITKWLLTSKFTQKDPWNLVFAIFLLAVMGHVCDMMYATIFLLWTLVLKLADKCGYERKSMFVTFMITMISVISVSTGLCFPWKVIVLAFSSMYDPTMYSVFPYAKHMFISLLYIVLFIIGLIAMAKYVFKMDISKFKIDEETIKEYEDMQIEPIHKFGLYSILSFALIMFLSSLLPSGSVLSTWFNKLGLAGIIFIYLVIFSLLKDSDGNKLIDMQDAHSMIPWSVIWILLFVTPLCDAMQSTDSGIMTMIGQVMVPLFSGLNTYVFMATAIVLIGVVTQVLNNVVIAAIFLPVFYTLANSLGVNTYIFFIVLILVLNCDAATPAGSMSGAMCHGHSDVDKKYVYLFGILASILTIVICVFVLMPIGSLIC